MANKTTSEELQLALADIDGTVIVRISKEVSGNWQNYYVTFADLATYIASGGSVAWGAITGTLTDQTDLVTALATKEPTITAGTTGQYWRGDKTWQTLDKTAVGLSNVDNTSDVNKPVSTAQAAADAAAIVTANAYSDSLVVGLWDDRGSFDASGGAYPATGGSGAAGAILKGDIWTISVAGTLPTGQVVEIGDVVRALVNTPGNTQANWAITQNNIGYVAENSANKTSTVAGNTASTTLYLTVKGYFDWLLQGLTQALSAKVTPVDADSVLIEDSADSNKTKKTTWANIKTTLATYFSGIYQTLAQQQAAGTALVVFRQTISAVQAQTLNSAPIVIADLPAPGAGKAWAIVELSIKYTFVTADYLFAILTTGNTTGIAGGAGQALTTAPFGTGGADAWCSSFIGGAGGAKTNIYENEGVEIKSDADDILVGDGTFIIYGTARLITL